MSHADLLHSWLQTVWIDNNFRKGESYFHDDNNTVFLSGAAFEVQEYETIIGSICTKVRPYEVEMLNVIEKGDEVSCIANIKTRRLTDAKPVDVETFQYRRIRDGKFIESRVSLNMITLFTQLGQLPDDTIAGLLMGESFVES